MRRVLRLAILFSLAGMLACSFDVSLSVSFKLSINARVLSPAATQSAEVTADKVTFPADAVADQKLDEGSVLITDDFIRRATHVDRTADKVTVTTEDASLADVVEEGETSTVDDLGARTEIRTAWGAVTPQAVWTGKGFEFDVKHQVVFEDPTTGAALWLDGNVFFRPSIELSMKFGYFKLKSATAIARGQFGASLTATGRVTGSAARSYAKTLWASPTFSVTLPPIGPVPIRFQAQLTLRAIVTVSAIGTVIVRTGLEVAANGAFGVRYNDGNFDAVREWTPSGSVTRPTIDVSATVDVRAALRAELAGGFYGGLGPLSAGGGLRLVAEPYVEAHADPTALSAKAGIKADSDVFLKLLWREFPSRPIPLYDGLLSQSAEKTVIIGQCKPGSVINCGSAPGCTPCKSGEACSTKADCPSGSSCTAGVCGVRGSAAPGATCGADSDCTVGALCSSETSFDGSTTGRCRTDHCSNQQRDADETDNDCGGKDCARCRRGSACRIDADCAEGLCVGGTYCWRR